MPYYTCTFVSDSGLFSKKVVFSENKGDLWKNYTNADEKLLSVRRVIFRYTPLFKIFSRKIGYFEFHLFNQMMVTLLKSGVTFIRALEIVIANQKKGNLKEILSKCLADLRNGIQISDAFSTNAIPFPKIYRASLLAGERSGNIESILERFNVYLGKIANLRRRVISSMTYPVILFVFMIGLVLVILVYAIPKFASFYEDFDASLPVMTTVLISVGTFLKDNIMGIAIIIVLIVAGIKMVEKLHTHIVIVDYLKTRVPFVGKILVENAMTVFSRTLAILIAGGIPVPEAVQISVETFNNRYFARQVKDVPVKIKEGNSLSDVLAEVKFVPNVLIEVIRVGESSGNLVGVLNESADSFENSIDAKISALISLIEPILIVALGLVIAFMLMAIYLPIFNTVNIVR